MSSCQDVAHVPLGGGFEWLYFSWGYIRSSGAAEMAYIECVNIKSSRGLS